MKDNNANLRTIVTLREMFNCDVGYSGHEPSVSPSIIAATLGANSIERHITLDRTMYGSDQAASLELRGMIELINRIKNTKPVIGDGKKRIIHRERTISKKLRYWE